MESKKLATTVFCIAISVHWSAIAIAQESPTVLTEDAFLWGTPVDNQDSDDEGEVRVIVVEPVFPALFEVTGLQAENRLNVRALPSADGVILGTLGHDETGIEIVALSEDGRWGQVPWLDRSGWIAMNYLTSQIGDGGIPRPMACHASDASPPWSLMFYSENVTIATAHIGGPDFGELDFEVWGEIEMPSGYLALLYDDHGLPLNLSVTRSICSDGTGGRPYGLHAMLWRFEEEGSFAIGDMFFEGCCTLAP